VSAVSGVRAQAESARAAAQVLAQLDGATRRAGVRAMADAILADRDAILAANAEDLAAAAALGTGGALLDRLRLDAARLDAIAAGVRAVAELPDPVGAVTRRERRPNGIEVERVRIPLGVIAMIYEARPNVTADAAALCFFAGNAALLRGGSEARASNRALAAALRAALVAQGLPADTVALLADTGREAMVELLALTDLIDLAIPRGGPGLIRFVAEHARVPVIRHYQGVCHLFVDASADLDLALALLIDGKTTRPAVCNALETLLVHADCAKAFLPRAAAALAQRGVEVRACAASRALVPEWGAAQESDFGTEFLDRILAVRVLPDLDAAITHIRRHGSDHTEVIATRDAQAASRFERELRSAVIMVNASSRFSDGGELGLGAEIGVSTTRLHAYGPMGAEALTIERYVVRGTGQVRHPPGA